MKKALLILLICLITLSFIAAADNYHEVKRSQFDNQPLKRVISFGANRVLEELDADGDISDRGDYDLDRVISVWKKQSGNHRVTYKIRARFEYDAYNGDDDYGGDNNQGNDNYNNDYGDGNDNNGNSGNNGYNGRYLQGYYGSNNNNDDNGYPKSNYNDNNGNDNNDEDEYNQDTSDTDHDFEITYVVRHNTRTGGNNLLQHFNLVWLDSEAYPKAAYATPMGSSNDDDMGMDYGNDYYTPSNEDDMAMGSSNDEDTSMASTPMVSTPMASTPKTSTPKTSTPKASTPKASTAAATTHTVTISDNKFTPNSLTVKVGDTVTWKWTGQNPHNVTFDDGVHSVTQMEGTFDRKFTAKGTYPYHCTIHGLIMSGVITVE